MPRHAILRHALGRAAPSRAAARCMPLSTPTPTSFFSTTASNLSENDGQNSNRSSSSSSPSPAQSRSKTAALRISQLNRQNNGNNADSSQEGNSTPRVIDARALKVSPNSPGASSGPKVLNLRSLRGRGGSAVRGRVPFGAGDGSVGRGRLAARLGGRMLGSGGFGRGRGGARSGLSARGGAGGRARGSGRARRPAAGKGIKKESGDAYKGTKMTFTPEEQEVINRIEQGEVVPFEPKLTLDDLAMYAPPLATDAPLGRVGTVLRTMQVMTGGMPYNPTSGVTHDVQEAIRRYRAKKPIFVHSQAEKAWIEWAKPKYRLVPPNEATRKAIVETVIRGKYDGPGYADLTDFEGIMSNHLSRTFTYTANDRMRFVEKVLSLLPPQAKKPAATQASPKP